MSGRRQTALVRDVPPDVLCPYKQRGIRGMFLWIPPYLTRPGRPPAGIFTPPFPAADTLFSRLFSPSTHADIYDLAGPFRALLLAGKLSPPWCENIRFLRFPSFYSALPAQPAPSRTRRQPIFLRFRLFSRPSVLHFSSHHRYMQLNLELQQNSHFNFYKNVLRFSYHFMRPPRLSAAAQGGVQWAFRRFAAAFTRRRTKI